MLSASSGISANSPSMGIHHPSGNLWNPFRPTPIGNVSANLYINADYTAGSDADVVTAFTDRSGAGNHFVQSDADQQPLLKKGANGMNGHNVYRFDGSNDIMEASNFSTASQGSLFVAYRINTLSTGATLLSSADVGTTNYYLWITGCLSAATPVLQISQKSNDVVDDVRGQTNIVAGVPILASFHSTGTAYSMRYHGSEGTFTVATGSDTGDWFGDTVNRDNITIGGSKRFSESRFLNGDIQMVLMFPTCLGEADTQIVERWISNYLGLWYSSVRYVAITKTDTTNYMISNRVSGETTTYTQWHMTKQSTPLDGWETGSNTWNIRDLTVKSTSDIVLGNKSAAWEYACDIGSDADDSGDYGWFGSIHQSESAQSMQLTLDGRDTSNMITGETRYGSSVQMVQTINTIYPKDKTTVVGTTTLTHNWSRIALDVLHSHTFVPGYKLYNSYCAMAPTTSAGTPAGIDTYKVGDNDAAARVNDDAAKNKPTETDTIIGYHSSAHSYRLALSLPYGGPDSTGLWTYSGDWKAWFKDGVDADDGKMYINWVDGDFADRVTPPSSSQHWTRYVVSKT